MLSRSLILRVADWAPTKAFITRSPISRGVVRRFVAGDTVEEAIVAARKLNADGFPLSLDLLGENTHTPDEACAALKQYMRLIDAIEEAGVNSNISIKLTQLGLDLSDDFAEENLVQLLQRASKAKDPFVRVDMESSAYTERTVSMIERVFPHHPNVGTVIQAALYRSPEDVERLVKLGARIRLVKGAYLEPASVAIQEMPKINEQFDKLAETLLAKGHYPAIASHDEARLAHAKQFAEQSGLSRDKFEFQMLYGIRRDLQRLTLQEGYRTRIYVPYGDAWYPYFSRRLAERPANIAFFLKNLVRK